MKKIFALWKGIEKERLVKTRVNQNFFARQFCPHIIFLVALQELDIPDLLIASHIIPWSRGEKDRLNPRNGLCLNALHDKAFDRGLMTITTDFKIKISSKIFAKQSVPIEKWIASFDSKNIIIPERFVPTSQILEYHNKNIFQV